MNLFEKKMRQRIRLHPELWQTLLAVPTPESLATIVRFRLLEEQGLNLAPWVRLVLPLWEHQACEGNTVLAQLIRCLEQTVLSPYREENAFLRPHLQRLRLLADTPGAFPFNPEDIQENLLRFLAPAETLADLPELEVVHFQWEEIAPLARDLGEHRLARHCRRYVQNLFYPERREAILAVLAYVAKNYPLLLTCRQAYALMLSLDDPASWGEHPFCVRLIANRYWDYRLEQQGEAK